LQDIDDPPGRHPLHVHPGQRQVQRLLGARAALQRTRVEAAAADLGHIEGHFADSAQYRLGFEAVGMVAPRGMAFVGASAKILGPLHLGNLVDQDAQRLAGAVQSVGKQRFVSRGQRVFLDSLCHGHVPFKKIGSSCPTAAGPCAPRSRPHSVGQNYRRDVALSQRLPKTEAAQTCAVMRAAYQLDAKQGMAKMQKQAEWLQREHPDAAAALREGLAERPSPSTPWACRRR
jgi:hypothetical protein